MDTDINDIWDLPLKDPVNNSDGDKRPSIPSSTPPRASNPPLFLPSDDDEEDDNARSNANAGNDANNNPDIDALFEGLDDIDDSFQELAPALDIAALRREADARNARAVRAELGTAAAEPSSAAAAAAKTKNNGGRGGVLDGLDGDGDGEEDGKKKRKPLPKLDETRLLGKDGFPQLLKDTKNFKPKGKGHEVIIIISYHPPLLSPLDLLLNACTDATAAPLPHSGNGLGSRASNIPILVPQIIPQNQIQGDRRPGGKALPFKAHAGMALDIFIFFRLSLRCVFRLIHHYLVQGRT
jgi:hypothetical protein